MSPQRSSWPLLAALTAAFLLLFWLQRHRSSFLAIEADAAAARVVASECGVSVAEAFALRDLVGVEAPANRWREATAAFAQRRQHLGDALAAVAAVGDPAAAVAVRDGAADATAAWRRFCIEPAASPGLRFLQLRERFAARAAARD